MQKKQCELVFQRVEMLWFLFCISNNFFSHPMKFNIFFHYFKKMIYISVSYTYGYHLPDFGQNGFIYTTFSILPNLYHHLQISALLLPSCFCHCVPPLWKKRINILLSSAVRVLLWKVALTADVWKVLKQAIIQ